MDKHKNRANSWEKTVKIRWPTILATTLALACMTTASADDGEKTLKEMTGGKGVAIWSLFPRAEVKRMVVEVAERSGVPVELALAVAKVDDRMEKRIIPHAFGFQPRAVIGKRLERSIGHVIPDRV